MSISHLQQTIETYCIAENNSEMQIKIISNKEGNFISIDGNYNYSWGIPISILNKLIPLLTEIQQQQICPKVLSDQEKTPPANKKKKGNPLLKD